MGGGGGRTCFGAGALGSGAVVTVASITVVVH